MTEVELHALVKECILTTLAEEGYMIVKTSELEELVEKAAAWDRALGDALNGVEEPLYHHPLATRVSDPNSLPAATHNDPSV